MQKKNGQNPFPAILRRKKSSFVHLTEGEGGLKALVECPPKKEPLGRVNVYLSVCISDYPSVHVQEKHHSLKSYQ